MPHTGSMTVSWLSIGSIACMAAFTAADRENIDPRARAVSSCMR
jgi:hypothetical protein